MSVVVISVLHHRKEYFLYSLDTKELLETKAELQNKMGVLDPELKTNLQFAISVMDTMPLEMKKNAELLVDGNQTLLSFRAGSLCKRYIVFQGHDGIKFHQRIKFNRELCHDDLHDAFFRGHECPHVPSCRSQAMKAVYPGHAPLEINIVCKELRITFSDPNPKVTIALPSPV